MSTLTFILPEVIGIVSLYSNIRLECEKFRDGNIEENDLIRNTSETRDRLVRETKKLFETIGILGKRNEDLTRDCSFFSERIANQADRISHWLEPSYLDINQVFRGIEEIESNI